MTPLTQQLEDKKKGCKEQIEKYDLILKCGDWIPTEFDRIKVYCPQCQAEIAILEQAIAEIKSKDEEIFELECKYKRAMEGWVDNANLLQKQRQEILDEVKEEIICHSYEYKYSEDEILHSIDNVRKQLNQPKEEQ